MKTRTEINRTYYLKSGQYQYKNNSDFKARKDETNRRYRENKRKWFKELKKTFCCNRCGEAHPACLEFHHIDPNEKDYAVSEMMKRFSRVKILKEIAKCEILCANCHMKQHHGERFE